MIKLRVSKVEENLDERNLVVMIYEPFESTSVVLSRETSAEIIRVVKTMKKDEQDQIGVIFSILETGPRTASELSNETKIAPVNLGELLTKLVIRGSILPLGDGVYQLPEVQL